MSTEQVAINPLLGTDSVDAMNEIVSKAYVSLEDLKEIEVPAGTTLYDVVDALLDTFAGHASSGFPVAANELADFVRTAAEQVVGDGLIPGAETVEQISEAHDLTVLRKDWPNGVDDSTAPR